MRTLALACLFALAVPAVSSPVLAQAAAPAKMSTATTTIGELLENPGAKAVLTKYLPDVVNSDQISMASGMTLKDIQAYAADSVTDAKLAQIDADLAKLPATK